MDQYFLRSRSGLQTVSSGLGVSQTRISILHSSTGQTKGQGSRTKKQMCKGRNETTGVKTEVSKAKTGASKAKTRTFKAKTRASKANPPAFKAKTGASKVKHQTSKVTTQTSKTKTKVAKASQALVMQTQASKPRTPTAKANNKDTIVTKSASSEADTTKKRQTILKAGLRAKGNAEKKAKMSDVLLTKAQDVKQSHPGPSTSADVNANSNPMCAICLEDCLYPLKLPCSHVFCFLCAKGAILNDEKCPLCRQFTPHSVLQTPVLVDVKNKINTSTYSWFYEGSNNTWWQYDECTNKIIEDAFQSGRDKCEALIAGHIFEINLHLLLQMQKDNPFSQIRAIKRDKSNVPNRGVAGIEKNNCAEDSKLPF